MVPKNSLSPSSALWVCPLTFASLVLTSQTSHWPCLPTLRMTLHSGPQRAASQTRSASCSQTSSPTHVFTELAGPPSWIRYVPLLETLPRQNLPFPVFSKAGFLTNDCFHQLLNMITFSLKVKSHEQLVATALFVPSFYTRFFERVACAQVSTPSCR